MRAGELVGFGLQMAEITYGGSIESGSMDMRCLKSMHRIYFTDSVLDDDYKFSASGLYYAPPTGSLSSYVDYLSGLPVHDDPSVFGLHPNADIASRIQEGAYVMDTAMGVQAQGDQRVAGHLADKPQDVFVGDCVRAMLTGPTQLPAAIGYQRGAASEASQTSLDPMEIVLESNIGQFNQLLQQMRQNLDQLQKAVAGHDTMTDELTQIYDAVASNSVPSQWKHYLSLKPLGSWLRDLHDRIANINKWNADGKPKHFWLSGLFDPQLFLTCAMQVHATKYGLPVDTLQLTHKARKAAHTQLDKVPEDGVVVYGMFLHGASFDWESSLLNDSIPAVVYSQLPPFHLVPAAHHVRDATNYECPLYKTAGRQSSSWLHTDLVAPIDLATKNSVDYWILMGVAAVLSLDS